MTDPCLVCGSVESENLYAATYKGTVDEAVDYFLANRVAAAHGPIVRCRVCSFVFTSPRFHPCEYDRIYKSVIRPERLDRAFTAAKIARFRRLASIIGRHRPNSGPFLDFGCGDGTFLKVFGSPAGRGFEIGPEGRREVGGCEIVTGNWADVAGSDVFPPASFDFVTAFDVLEHLPRIEEDLALLRTVLRPDGLLFATVPNVESALAKALGKRWSMFLLEHLWYFSPKPLERLVARHGLEVVEFRSLPFDAPLAHVATRVAQTFGMKGVLRTGPLSRAVLPIPAGLMLGVFRKTG